MKAYTPQGWYDLAKNLYEMILAEIDSTSADTPSDVYSQLTTMYEFFRLIRGEAFNSVRPEGMGDFQKEIYKMEDDLSARLKSLKQN